MQEWIKCEDKLPEKPGRYLIFEIKGKHSHNCLAFNYPIKCCESNIAYFRLFQNFDWEYFTNCETKCNPTHWMPLPLLPKG